MDTYQSLVALFANAKLVRRDIKKFKSNLIKKALKHGICENFGQKEVRKLRSKYADYIEIDNFNDWCANYEGVE
jgi:hypothetical protein